MAEGYIRLSRALFEHPLFRRDQKEKFSDCEAWIWLLFEAAWKPRRKKVHNAVIDLQRGQVAHSTRFMATAWGWDERKVRRFLGRLKSDAMIAAVSDAHTTLITICNYNRYQAGGAASAADSAAAGAADAPQTRRKLEEGNTSVAKATAQNAPLDLKQELFSEGLASLRRQTSKSEEQARRLIGKWLKEASNDSRKVLTKIKQAEADGVADAGAWVTAALASQSEHDFLWARG